MNILMVSPYFYPEGGGAENYIYNIAKRMVKKGNHITVLCNSQEKEEKEEKIDDIKVVRQKPDFKVSTVPIKLNLFLKMNELLKSSDIDLVNINFQLPYYPDVATFVSKLHNKPCVLTYHNDLYKNGFLMNSATQIYNYSINHSVLEIVNLIITPSPYCYTKSKFLEPFRSKVVWIPPGVDINRYRVGKSFKIHETYKLPEPTKIVLFVGVISKAHEHKGVDQLIKSFKKVLEDKDISNTYLVLVGRGDMVPEYKKMCKDLGILNKVIFTGFVDDNTLIDFYRSSDVVVLPSTTVQEGFGMVLIEGNACGKPVVGTRVGGIQHVIEDGETGLLVPPKDYDALANAIIKLLKDEVMAKKMGKKGGELVEKKYNWENLAEETERVFRKVIRGYDSDNRRQ
ncbi:MAG: glycosyltransferase family 4 protein [Petrotogales bacterium]